MAFVVDNSVVTGWWAASQATTYTEAVLDAARTTSLHAPALWVLEFANVLRRARLCRAVDEAGSRAVLDNIAALGIEVHGLNENPASVLMLALQFGLSTYDAAYLELALRLQFPIACKDGALAQAARRAGVGFFQP
ncbi:MAG: type II toxin-antitoxin system VapC family toxin [Betaproteobacteria bacterium]|nr:type II toxin-antitoxin system VapC family toxin [Betaproteobacteria bacterium]